MSEPDGCVCPGDWLSRLAGEYRGQARGLWPGAPAPNVITTTFSVAEDGTIVGRYIETQIDHRQSENLGTLKMISVDPGRASFIWDDRYGSGIATFNFVVEESRIHGVYGGPGERTVNPLTEWSGSRP